jgi:uncharacterized membrane protein YeaQ/YmgE (transglycosylase-associated protein family)
MQPSLFRQSNNLKFSYECIGDSKMTLTSLLLLLLVAGICGSIGRSIAGYSHGGCLVSIALGFIGALVGVWIAGQLHLPDVFVVNIGGERFPIVWSIIGSALFVAIISLLTRRRSY